ncbi:MAG: hypothetical protein ACLP2Y_14075 [Limisphaerales bacterium]
MDINFIREEEKRIQGAVTREYCDSSGNSDCIISDGIVNPEQYLSSSPRILWVLKEPYDNGVSYNNPNDGGWSQAINMNEKTDEVSRLRAFQPICYINYGIWSGHDWDAMPWLRESEEIRNGLKKIAFINISKLPGLKYSPPSRIVEAYQKHRGIILDQIKTYRPNIIFACDPHANLILEDLGFSTTQWNKSFGSAYSVKISSEPEQRLVWVWHPSQRGKVRRSEYVNDAIKAATADLQMPKTV